MTDFEPECGTTTGYNYGCRCEDCRYAMTVAKRNSRQRIARRNQSPFAELKHTRAQMGEWFEQGVCRTQPAEVRVLFFSTDVGDTAQAKAICHTCPVERQCLEYAIKARERYVWGGESERGRKRIRREREMGFTR